MEGSPPPETHGILNLIGKRWKPSVSRRTTTIQGYYFDPKHGGCLRNIIKSGRSSYSILGVYGNDELLGPGKFWSAIMTVGEEKDGKTSLVVHFNNKVKVHTKMNASFDMETKIITWEDGNRWLPCYCHPAQLKWNGSDAFMSSSYIGGI